MNNTRRTLSFLFTLGVLFTAGTAFSQPITPKSPPSDSALKKAEAAQKAAEKAEAAKKVAEKAAGASAAAEKAAVAQKAAENASAASAAAEKAESAKRAAEKAEGAAKAAEKAEAAKKAADKAAVANAAAEKAKVAQELSAKAQKAADKTEEASVAAEKAAAAQKASDKAAAAQKSAAQAEAAQKAAAKAEAARKSSDKATANNALEKAAVRQAAAQKLTTINNAAAKAAPAPDVIRIRALNQPAPETKGGDDKKTPDLTVKGEPRNPISDRKAREEAARSVNVSAPAPAAPAPTAADEIRLTKDTVRDGLADLEVAPEVAKKLADDFVDPDKAPATRVRVEELANTSLDLQTVAVPEATRRKIIDEVSRSADPAATANEKVGEAATEEVFGKDVAALVPVDKRGKFREVFQNLADLRSGLETIGGSPEDPEVVEAVKEGAVRGVTTREETRVIFEGAGQKVLDRQGFSPAKEGEDFSARLGRIAKEQEAELAAMKAAKAAAAAAAAAKLTRGKVSLGEGITQGAAGSTVVGRSVSARVEVAIGGGKDATSGAGTASQGTGTDASKATGTGGQFRSELLTSRLPADTGGTSTAGQVTTGRAGETAPGTPSAPAVSSTPATQGALEAGVGVNGAQPAEAAAPVSPGVNEAGPNSPAATSSTVSSPANEFVVGGGEGSSFGGHFQSDDGNTGGNLTFNPDGTFSGTVTTVTRDASGNITNSSESSVVGTWGVDANGNVVVTSATTAPSTSSDNNQSTPPAGNQSSNSGSGSGTGSNSSSSTSTSSSDDDDDDDDDDDGDDDTPPPPPPAETKTEETPAAETAEETKAADSTPNPMDDGGVSPTVLAEKTGGRLGGSEARRQQRSLQLAGSGGGAGGPDPDGNSTTQTLLTPEEEANAARFIGSKTGGGVTNPNPIKAGGMAVTDRDLKELHLRGNGGAAGPTDTTAPAPPQDPNSPVPGLAPGPAPAGGTRIDVQATAVQVDRIDVSGQIRENTK